MKFYHIFAVVILALAILAGVSIAQEEPQQATPVDTAITYQGRLAKSGQPVDATCAMTFRLYDHETAGSQIGPDLNQDVTVVDGLFTVRLDFGADVFDGQARWLEIAVRCPGDAGPTKLPRVALNAAPYAHYALAAPWDGIQDMPPGFADGVDNDTQYRAGWGLRQQGTAFSVDERLIQSRVVSSCSNSEAIRQIDEDGSITCEPLQGPLTAVAPLELNGDVLRLDQGAGSGLDADTLDAKDSTEFLILDQDQTIGGSPTFANTVPFAVDHATLIPNLNAEQLGGKDESRFFTLNEDEQVTGSPTFANTVPFTVTHATLIPNLNAGQLGGKDESRFFTLNEDEQVTGSPTFANAIPFTVTHATLIPNLNAEQLDGRTAEHYFRLDAGETVTVGSDVAFDSTPTFGANPPFAVSGPAKVSDLNADLLDGLDSSDYFQLDKDGQVVSGTTTFAADVTFDGRPAFDNNSGPPFTVASTEVVLGLNADQLDGQDASAFLTDADLTDYFNLTENETVGGNTTFDNSTTTTFDGFVNFNNDVTFGNTANVTFDRQVAFNASGQAPFTVNSNLLVLNLHADDSEHLGGQPPTFYQNADNINGGTLGTAYYSAHDDLQAEGYLGNANGDLAQNNGVLQKDLDADLLDGKEGDFYRDASNISDGTLGTDYYSAHDDLQAEGYLGNANDDLAQNNGIRQVNLNADMLDGNHASAFAQLANMTVSSGYCADTGGYASGCDPSVYMVGGTNSFCFLTQVKVRDVDSNTENAGCAISWDGSVNKWLLQAIGGTDDEEAYCEAMCFSW